MKQYWNNRLLSSYYNYSMNESFSYQFLQLVKSTLDRYVRFHPGKNRILIACSGGADSVVLLDSLYQLRTVYDLDLQVAHINHGLRGTESDGDEAFVIDLARRYDISCTVRRFDTAEIEEIHANNLEESARTLRYRKLEHTAVELDCSFIATGHTRSDQAETVLHRIVRSTGLTGLAGILPLRTDLSIPVIRPLLFAGREQIIRYAQENQLSYRQDAMNADLRFTRVRIRRQLLPLLRKNFNPQIEEALNHLASLAQDDEAFWQSYVENLRLRVGEATEGSPADRRRFLHLTCAEQSRLIRRYCSLHGIEPTWLQIESVLSLLRSERPQSETHLSADFRFYRRYDDFYLAPPLDLHEPTPEYTIRIPGITGIPDMQIRVETVIVPANVHHIKPLETHTAEFDADKVRHPIVIRTRREGDVIRPLGMDGTKRIKKIFQEKRVPLENRERIPLLCFDEDIAWIAGFCMSDTYRIDVNTRQVLLVSIHPIELDKHS